MIKGVIFDLDGVICFTDRLHYIAWKQAVEPLGVEFDERVNNRLRGVSREQSLEIILEKYDGVLSEERKAAICAEKNEIYKSLLVGLSPADVGEDVNLTLGELRRRGILTAVGSSSKNTRLILRQLGLVEQFDAVTDGNMITHSKPHPEVFLKAAEAIGLSPSDCLVVEDAEAGIDAGNAGGFATAGIGEASRYAKTLYPIGKLSDILNLLD